MIGIHPNRVFLIGAWIVGNLVLLGTVLVQAAGGQGGGPTTICHLPPGDPDAAHTITVSAAALPAHLGHGDPIGACAPSCAGSGAACSDHADCCSTFCNQSICETPCVENGIACSTSAECCSGFCGGGLCATPCAGNGDPCTVNEQCCGNNCQDGACVPPCTVNGAACSSNAQCCSGSCQSGTCVPACATNGGLCTLSAECCSGICSGEGICAAECTIGPELGGAACSFELPCCPADGPAGGVCIAGLCYPEDATCEFLGEACDPDSGLFCCFDALCIENVCVAP